MKTRLRLKLLLFLFFSLLLQVESYAQKEANNWYFGFNAGLSFNSNPSQILTNGQATGEWGHAAVSDASGNLLFYACGQINNNSPRLLDRRHLGMPNSVSGGINGNSAANTLIVPWPGQPQKFFFFSQYTSSIGFYNSYSLIDMNLNGGFGDISPSANNQFIHSIDALEVLGIHHRNNRDFWIIYQNDSTNIFSAYLISPSGINLTPVISTPLFTPGTLFLNNSLKVSPDGKTLAMVIGTGQLINKTKIELFNFDALSGAVTYKGIIPDSSAQGIEFSPDGSKLFATRVFYDPSPPYNPHFELNQYDLDAGTGSPTDIYNSKTMIYQAPPQTGGTAMQVAPDGKIYVNTYLNPSQPRRYLSVINRPNLKGTACRFVPNMIDVDPNNTGLHLIGETLPTFIQSYFYRPKITMQQTCFGDTAFFALGNPAYVDSVEWNFGDPASGVHNTSTLFNPKHFYASPGPKQVQAIVHFNFDSDTLHQTVYIPASITKPNLGNDTTLCLGDTLRLNAYQPGASYEWQDSINTDSVYVVTRPGTYWVSVSNGCGTLGDTIVVNFDSPLSVSLPNDTTLCPGETLTLSVNAGGGNLLWSDSTAAATFTVSKPGTYWAQLSNVCGSRRDSITINYRPVVKNNWLPKDTILCSTAPFTINGTNPAALTYRWQDGSTAPTFTASASGTYWLEITTTCATLRDSVQVTINKLPETRFRDTTICSGDSFKLTAPKALSYRWNTGDTAQSITISKAGNYHVALETVKGCFFSDSVEVKTERCFKTAFIPNIVTPNNDQRNDQFEPKGLEAGTYELSIYNRWGTLIYQQENYTNQWPDKKISHGTYYYLLRNQQTGKTYKGWVEIVD